MPDHEVAPGLFVDDADGPRLLVGRCPICHRYHFPADPSCPYCGAGDCETVRAGAHGHLWLYTAVHARPPGYLGEVPYGFGVVTLDVGLRVISRLTEHRLERLRPGLPVRLVLSSVGTTDQGAPQVCWAFAPEGT